MARTEARNFQRLAVIEFHWPAYTIHAVAVLTILRVDAAHAGKSIGRWSRRRHRRSFRFGVSCRRQVAARARYQRADDYHQERSAETHSLSLSNFFLERGQYTTRVTV